MVDLLTGLGASSVLWGSLYAASLRFLTPSSLKKRDDRVYWASSIVSIVHAIFAAVSATWLLYTGTVPAWSGFGEPSPAWEKVIMMSFGYFAYDFTLLLASPSMPQRAELALHHILGITLHLWPVCVHQKFAPISCVGYLCEWSTPFVTARWMLKEAAGGTGTKLYLVNGLAIVISFFCFRVLGGLAYLYQIFVLVPRLAPPHFGDLGLVGYLLPPGVLVFYALNLFWMHKILTGALKLLKGSAGKQAMSSSKADAYPVKAQD